MSEDFFSSEIAPSIETKSPRFVPAPQPLSTRLTQLPGKVDPKGRESLMKRVHSPFYRITEHQYDQIVKVAGGSDVMLFEGLQQVAFGEVDGQYALMPLHRPL